MNQTLSNKDLTKTILILAAGIILIPTLVVAPGLGYAIKPFLNKKYQPSRINQTMQRLQSQKLISITEKDHKTKIELLDKGKRKILAYKFEELALKQNKWDQLWRVVIFDIPEKKKVARNLLRSKMKELGFYSLQKSVLVTPWKCEEVIDYIKFFYGVEDHVNLILAKHIDNEKYLKQYFKL